MKLNDPIDLISVQVLGLGVTVELSHNDAATAIKVCASWAVGCWVREWVWLRGTG